MTLYAISFQIAAAAMAIDVAPSVALPFESVNETGQVLRITRHGDGFAVSLSLPGVPPEQINPVDPNVVLSPHTKPDQYVSLTFGDIIFDWDNAYPPPQPANRLCKSWPGYPADEGCEDFPAGTHVGIHRRLPSGQAATNQFLRELPRAKMIRVKFVTPEGNQYAVFFPQNRR